MRIHLRSSLFYVLTLCVTLQGYAVEAQVQDANKVELATFIHYVAKDFRNGLPATLCTKEQFVLACFRVTQDECLQDMATFVDECANALEAKYENNRTLLPCESKQECQEVGASIGKKAGQEIGSCAGTRFELKHPDKVLKEQCIAFLNKNGLDTDTLFENKSNK